MTASVRAVKFLAAAVVVHCCARSVSAQGLGPPRASLQLPALTEGRIAQSSLNSVLQTLPPGLSKNKLAVQLNRLATSAKELHAEEFQLSANEAKAALVAARLELTSGANREVLDIIAATLKATEKAYYSRDLRRNYLPESYRTIFERSHNAVALVQKSSSAPFCSGALVSPSLVLTAKHCLNGVDLTDLELWRGYVQHEDGSTSAPIRIPFSSVEYSPTDPSLDFALLRVEGHGVIVQDPPCISSDRVRLRELLYIVGHPQQRPLTVHDFAEVLFPYEVQSGELNQILLDQQANNAKEEVLSSIKSSYVATEGGNFANRSQVWGGQPTIGILADTFRGNSGSPVFSRNTHRLVGIFVRGQPDYSEPWTASWLRHEAVLPAAEIIKDLRAHTSLLGGDVVCVR